MKKFDARTYRIPLCYGRFFDARFPLVMTREEFDLAIETLKRWADYYFDPGGENPDEGRDDAVADVAQAEPIDDEDDYCYDNYCNQDEDDED